MKSNRSIVTLGIAFVLAAIVCGSVDTAVASSQIDSLFAERVQVPGPPWPDSFAVPIYIAMDDTVHSLSACLRAEEADTLFNGIVASSFRPNTNLFKVLPDGYWGPAILIDGTGALNFDWTSVIPGGLVPAPHGHVGDLYFRVVDPAIPVGTQLQIDTIDIQYVAPSIVGIKNGPGTLLISAPWIAVADNVVFGQPIACGDVDASGFVDVTDAVYLINYIFAKGNEPRDPFGGDSDCSGSVNITDAVYIINFIFAGGPSPCAACR